MTKEQRDKEVEAIQRVVSANERVLRALKRAHYPASVTEDAAWSLMYLRESNRSGARQIAQLKDMRNFDEPVNETPVEAA